MAAQLKNHTLSMNSQLQSQASNLDKMETLVLSNLESVTKVTENVTDHVSKGWKKSIATWTLLFIVMGVFLFCFLVIYSVPKRKNACLFWCDNKKQSDCLPRDYRKGKCKSKANRWIEDMKDDDDNNDNDGYGG